MPPWCKLVGFGSKQEKPQHVTHLQRAEIEILLQRISGSQLLFFFCANAQKNSIPAPTRISSQFYFRCEIHKNTVKGRE